MMRFVYMGLRRTHISLAILQTEVSAKGRHNVSRKYAFSAINDINDQIMLTFRAHSGN